MEYDKDKFTPHEAVYDFLGRLGVPQTLKEVGIQKDKLDEMAELSISSNWVKANCKHLSVEDINRILLDAYEDNFKYMYVF